MLTCDGGCLWKKEFVEQHKENLALGTDVKVCFEDIEAKTTWEGIERNIGQRGGYDVIIAHYLLDFIRDKESFLSRIAKVLAPAGMCSVNGVSVSREHGFWQEVFEKVELRTDFLRIRELHAQKERAELEELLSQYFSKVEKETLESLMRYTDANEVYEYLLERYPEVKKYLTEQEAVLKEYFTMEIKEKGAFLLPKSTDFQHCYK